jgi:hypothetical protein
VILLLAIGIGASTLMFTATDVLLLRPLGVPDPHQLVRFGLLRPNTFRDTTLFPMLAVCSVSAQHLI